MHAASCARMCECVKAATVCQARGGMDALIVRTHRPLSASATARASRYRSLLLSGVPSTVNTSGGSPSGFGWT